MENADNIEVNVEHYIVIALLGQLGIDIVSNFIMLDGPTSSGEIYMSILNLLDNFGEL